MVDGNVLEHLHIAECVSRMTARQNKQIHSSLPRLRFANMTFVVVVVVVVVVVWEFPRSYDGVHSFLEPT